MNILAFMEHWKETLAYVKEKISEHEYNLWFLNMQIEKIENNEIIISVPSKFYKDQLKRKYSFLIEEKMKSLLGTPITIVYSIAKKDSTEPSENLNPEIEEKNPEEPLKKHSAQHPQLRPEYSFENFIIGDNNSFAANAAIAIAKNPGKAYNPCLIYGGVGLGKTHLIQSIGNAIYHNKKNLKIIYITTETFINEFIQSIQLGKTAYFKNKYRLIDILLLDDIHDFQEKKQTQEELFHTFNALYDANKQMVFTCDRPVSELKSLSERLRNRFERGLNVDLQPPNYETRFAILQSKIKARKKIIPDSVIELIAKNVTTNIRDLEAALTKITAYADLVDKNMSIEIAQSLLKDIISTPKNKNISIDLIQQIVASYFNCSKHDLKGKKRTAIISFPRQLAMYISRELTEFSTTEVGLEFGGRDHTTVMHAYQKIENLLKTDLSLEPTLHQLIRSIKEYKT